MTYKNNSNFYEMKLEEFKKSEDPLRKMMEFMLFTMMEAEVNELCNADKGQHSEERAAYRSGYRSRNFDTRVGSIELKVPKLRNGGYIPFFINENQRCEEALVNVICEAYVKGVSTRKMNDIVQCLGLSGISPTEVSNITKNLNEQVNEFRNAKLEKEYPVIWVDALYEKVRENHKTISAAIMVVRAVDLEGRAKTIAIEGMPSESEDTYTNLFNSLKERGLEKVWLVVSDAHKGLKAAIQKCFIGSSWQRCKVHFMRNILSYISQKKKKDFASELKQIWLFTNKHTALEYAKSFIAKYELLYPKAIKVLEDGLEDSLSFYDFEELDSRKTSSNNSIERLNKEIRRRTKVVGVFPSMDSYLRLITVYVEETEYENASNRCYLAKESIVRQAEIRKVA